MTPLCDSEVSEADYSGFGRKLRGEARVGKMAGEEHPEVFVQVHVTSCDFDGASVLLPNDLLIKHSFSIPSTSRAFPFSREYFKNQSLNLRWVEVQIDLFFSISSTYLRRIQPWP